MLRFRFKSLVVVSLAKLIAVYSFFMAILMTVFDLVMKLTTGSSMFVGTNVFWSWVVFAIIYLIISPVVGFVMGFVMGILINLALRVTDGLEIDLEQ